VQEVLSHGVFVTGPFFLAHITLFNYFMNNLKWEAFIIFLSTTRIFLCIMLGLLNHYEVLTVSVDTYEYKRKFGCILKELHVLVEWREVPNLGTVFS
jgi:hypothetical protein